MKTQNRRYLDEIKRLLLILLASVVMSLNIKSFVEAGGLFRGFNGLTLLIQRSADQFFGITLPFSLINFLLNAVPAFICYRTIGKRFTIYSCIMILFTSVLTDLIPTVPLTNDVLLICIFGGIINGFAIGLCLMGRATSGGTDFIAISLSERRNIDAWNYILPRTWSCCFWPACCLAGKRRFTPSSSNLLPPRWCGCSTADISRRRYLLSRMHRTKFSRKSERPRITAQHSSMALGFTMDILRR